MIFFSTEWFIVQFVSAFDIEKLNYVFFKWNQSPSLDYSLIIDVIFKQSIKITFCKALSFF